MVWMGVNTTSSLALTMNVMPQTMTQNRAHRWPRNLVVAFM